MLLDKICWNIAQQMWNEHYFSVQADFYVELDLYVELSFTEDMFRLVIICVERWS